MIKTHHRKALIVCTSLLIILMAGAAVAESIGQKTMRLKREARESKESSGYERKKLDRTAKKDATKEEQVVEQAAVVDLVEIEKAVEVVVEARQVASAVERQVVSLNDPLRLVPADSLVCVRINNFGGSLSQLDQYLTGVSPLPLSMMAMGPIGTILGNPMLSGIDFNGNVILFAKMSADTGMPSIALFVPVKKYEIFTGENPSCADADADGVSAITPPNGMLGNLISVKAPGGKYAMVGQPDARATLLEIANSKGKSTGLAGTLGRTERKLAGQSPVWVYGNLETAAEMFIMPMIMELLQDGYNKANKAVSEKDGKKNREDMYRKTAMIKDTISQLKSLSLTLTPVQDKLTLGVNLTAKEGSEIAKVLVANPAAENGFELAGYFKDAAAMNLVAKINKPLLIKIANALKETIPADSDPAMVKSFNTFFESANALGSEMGYSLSPGTGELPFTFKQMIKISDKNMIDNLIQMQIGIFEGVSQAADSTKIDKVPYGHSMIYSMEMPTPDTSSPAGAIALPQVHVTAANDMMLTSMGEIEDMKVFAHRCMSGAGRPGGNMAKALNIVENSGGMDFVASVDLLEVMSIGSKAAKASPVPQAQMVSGMLSSLNSDSKSCMAIAGKIDAGAASMQFVLPKDHLVEVMGAFMQMQQQMMQMQMTDVKVNMGTP